MYCILAMLANPVESLWCVWKAVPVGLAVVSLHLRDLVTRNIKAIATMLFLGGDVGTLCLCMCVCVCVCRYGNVLTCAN